MPREIKRYARRVTVTHDERALAAEVCFQYRVENGLTQEEMATELGCTAQRISHAERRQDRAVAGWIVKKIIALQTI